MSRINIIASFKIYSLSDTYYAVGSSLTGSFGPFRLGKGEELYVGDAAALKVDKDALAAFEDPDGGGQLVSKVIPLGENYGDFKIRLYAENDLGIRSAYVEADKLIIAPDITGTFRFQDVSVRNLKHLKPSAFGAITQVPNKSNNELRVSSEFIGKEFTLQWRLRAPYGVSGNARGIVDENTDFFDHFKISFHKAPTNGADAPFDGDWEELLVPDSFGSPISAAELSAYYNFHLSLSKDQIAQIYGEEARNIYIKIVGRDLYYNSVEDADKPAHEFSALVSLENRKTELDSCFAELYGKNLEISYTNKDPDFSNEDIFITQYIEEDGEFVRVGDKSFAGPGQTLSYEQDWSSASSPHKYKYVITLGDSYGLCGYYGVKVPGSSGSNIGAQKSSLDAALTDATPLESVLEVGAIDIAESGSSFVISWNVVDGRGHQVELDENGEFRMFSPAKQFGEQINDVSGFSCRFDCPEEYVTNAGSSIKTPDFGRDMFALSGENFKNSSPTIKSITPEFPLEVSKDRSFVLTKEQNASLYRSWFNENNHNHRTSEVRVLYKQLTGDDVRNYGETADFYAIDAQRKIKVTVILMGQTGRVIDSKTKEAHNPPPSIKVDKIDRQSAGKVVFEAPYSERVSTVRVYRRPYKKYHETAIFVDSNGVEKTYEEWLGLDDRSGYSYQEEASTKLEYIPRIHNVDKEPNSSNQEISIYNNKSDNYFAEINSTDTSADRLKLMLYNTGIEVNGDSGEYKFGHMDGFHVGTSPGGGNFANSPTHGLDINRGDSVSYIDEPPVLRLNGVPQPASYDYVVIPYDDFGSGIAFDVGKVNVNPPSIASLDEDGAIGVLDFDPPEPISNLTIEGSNKTFFLEWEGSLSHDVDYYNLIYIRDTRSDTQRLDDDYITTEKGSSKPLNFNGVGSFVHASSEFHAKDLKFSSAPDVPINDWENDYQGGYEKDNYVAYSKTKASGQKSVKRLYKSTADNNTSEPTKSPTWQLMANCQVYLDGSIVYQDDVITREREDSSTWGLIYWQADKAYSANDIVFSDGLCYKALSDIPLEPSVEIDDTSKWKEVTGVSIQEIRIPRQETSLSVVADTNDRGYFFFESVDRSGNRSRIHANPSLDSTQGPNAYAYTLGQSELRDIKDFEKNLSKEFPNAILLRPKDPFDIKDNSWLRWKSHYIYSRGRAHFVKGGEISLTDSKFVDQASTEYIGYVYWDPEYGYDVGTSQFSKPPDELSEPEAIRDNSLDVGDLKSNIEGKLADETYQHFAFYSFCTGNPGSNTYNALDDGVKLSDSNLGLDALITKLNGLTDQDKIHDDADKFGSFGVHIPKSEKLLTQDAKSLLREGSFQIARVDKIDDQYSVEHNFVAFNNATIGQAWVSNATITNAQITDLKADKITTGEIGSHNITIGNSLIPSVENGKLVDGQLGSEGVPSSTSEYRYGAISSKGFGHNTHGKAGFFISGDGQFGFQTKTGGLFLRDSAQTGQPSELIFRGIWHSEEGLPTLFMDMESNVQNITFDEHASNHFYYSSNDDLPSQSTNVYGTETQIIYPANGSAVVDFTVDNAYHNDGTPYTNEQLKFKIYANGDPTQVVGPEELANILEENTLNVYRKKVPSENESFPLWVSKTVWLSYTEGQRDLYEDMSTSGIGLVDPSNINKGGSFALNFVDGDFIHFTGAAIDSAGDAVDAIIENLDEESLLDDNERAALETAGTKIWPIADSYTVELTIVAQTDPYNSQKSMYYKEDLVNKDGDIYRAKKTLLKSEYGGLIPGVEDTDSWEKIASTSDASLPSYIEKKKKTINIFRKDQPANLVEFSLAPQGGTI
ncbi:MAG: hypothetical protein CL885_03600, partial [Dehalococcoidia bacterium]|nr:hypothetical protein [Dehalococcoidia bacterium]